MIRRLMGGAVPVYLFLGLLLGGASAAGLWANVLLQLLAIPILFAAVAARAEAPLGRPARQLVALLLAMAGLVLLQLVPLPPEVWTALPGRGRVVEGFELLGRSLPWLPWSLAPFDTLASALWLLPAVAVLLAILKFPVRGAWIGWSIVAATAASVLVGALQIAGGTDSPWYFYRITNYGVMVGFFANANHMATLLVATVPFLAALFMAARSRRREAHRTGGLFVILAGLFALVLVGVAINGSLAGIGLMLPVCAASAMLVMRRRGIPAWAVAAVALLTLASVAAVFSGRFDNNLIASDAQQSTVSRYTTFSVSLEAAKDYFPLGSGIGTFQPVYRLYEDPERVTTTYVNHVHSDWIEIVLEAGLPGLALLLAFLAWWTARAVAIWRSAEPDPFARAATIASAAIIAHSLVDYPLRTAGLSAVFAACCALMAARRAVPPRPATARTVKRPARHLSAE